VAPPFGDNRCSLEVWISLDLPGGLIAVEDGKLDVHEYQVGPLGLGFRHSIPTVRRLGNFVT
jgi:hypothetical protein